MKITIPETGEGVRVAYTDALAKDLDAFRADACQHDHLEWRRLPMVNGDYQVKQFCPACGWHGTYSRKHQPGDEDTPFIDPDRAQKYAAHRKQVYAEIWLRHARIQRENYCAYLKSAEWQAIREAVLKRANYLCEGCRLDAATQVHHLTYEHLGNELLFELVALCRRCHARCHPHLKSEMEDASP